MFSTEHGAQACCKALLPLSHTRTRRGGGVKPDFLHVKDWVDSGLCSVSPTFTVAEMIADELENRDKKKSRISWHVNRAQ